MFRSNSSQFDKLLDKATSNLKLEPDWPLILQICDLIRQGDVQAKYALASIKKKMMNSNPHVAMFSLNVLESCVKNCGSLIHDEIGTKNFMEQLKDTMKTTTHENVKTKILELIQAWAYAFRNTPKYRAVQDTVNIMKTEGYKFPALKESDAMFSADTAPEWADGDCCHRCRVVFSIMQRKHHCRACGQVFCSQCTNKTCTLPKFGIEKEVRVCEACFEKVTKPTTSSKADDLPIEYIKSSLAQQSQAPPPRKSEAELKEEEELQLAIALSQSEAEHKNKPSRSNAIPATRTKSYSPPPKLSTSPEADPELARYLNRGYWQQQSTEYSNASAPVLATTSTPPKQPNNPEQNGVEDSEMEDFASTLQTQVEIFVNRMKSNSSRGRSIANDSSVQTLFMNITAMHSKLLRYIQQQDDRRVYFEGLQDKLTQVKDARAALDALRDEHREKLRREAEIAERQRQMQMAHKLDIMRKKKQEYLQYQRQLALQRIQEQEREMQIRQEQQKQQYLMGSQFATLPYMRQGYDMQGRYSIPNQVPPQQSAPPFPHFPPPPGTSHPIDPSIPPHAGGPAGPIMMGQSRSQMDQQGMMMRNQQGMLPGGMSPQGMMALGPHGALPMGHHLPMMGQQNPPQSQMGNQPPTGTIGPQSLQGPQSHPSQLPTGPQHMPGPLAGMGSQTLPRSLGQSSISAPQSMQPPSSLSGPQSLSGEPTISMSQPIQSQIQVGGPQRIQGQPSMNAPQAMQGPAPMSAPQPLPGQAPMNAAQSMPGQSSLGIPGQPAINGPQSLHGPPGMVANMQMPGQSLSQTTLPTMPQVPLPQHMAQNMPTMMGNQQQVIPVLGQQSFHQQPPSQPPQDDKTAELISFD